MKQIKMDILFSFVVGLTMVQAQTTMNIKTKSSTNTVYVISDTRKITFSGNNFVITKKDSNSSSYAISDTRYLNFSAGISTILIDAKQTTRKLTVYPNPVQNILTISLAANTSEHLQLDVFGINGIKVYSQAINAQQAVNQTINVKDWLAGIYLIWINNGREIVTTKFSKN